MKRPPNTFSLASLAGVPHHADMRIVRALVPASVAWGAGPVRSVTVGAGAPNVDVPAAQAATDRGGSVVLVGHFLRPASSGGRTCPGKSFSQACWTRRAPWRPLRREPTSSPSKAPGVHVTIRALRFVRPKIVGRIGPCWIAASARSSQIRSRRLTNAGPQ